MFHGEKLERYLYKYVPNRVLYLLDQARECERLRARTDAYAYRQQAYELAYLMYAKRASASACALARTRTRTDSRRTSSHT